MELSQMKEFKSVQRSLTRRIQGHESISYWEKLQVRKLYSFKKNDLATKIHVVVKVEQFYSNVETVFSVYAKERFRKQQNDWRLSGKIPCGLGGPSS